MSSSRSLCTARRGAHPKHKGPVPLVKAGCQNVHIRGAGNDLDHSKAAQRKDVDEEDDVTAVLADILVSNLMVLQHMRGLAVASTCSQGLGSQPVSL